MTDVKVPPHSIEAEQALLGGIIRLGKIPDTASIKPATFYRDSHRLIYESLSRMDADGIPFENDYIPIIEYMRGAGTLDAVGGPATIAALTDAVATAANIGHYAGIVRDKAALREVIKRSTGIADQACSFDAKPGEIIKQGFEFFSKLHQRYIECGGSEDEAENMSWSQRIERYIKDIDSVKSVNSVNGSVKVSVNDLYRSVNAVNAKDQSCVRKAVQKLVKQRVLEPIPGAKVGNYRLVDHTENVVDVWNAPDLIDLNLRWPFDIQDRFYLPPRSVIVVAGVSNAGKTAFALDFAHRNNLKMPTYYLVMSNESHPSKLKARAKQFGPKDEWAGCTFIDKPSGTFQDAIRPDGINIVDYLQVYDSFWLITETIAQIADRLNEGIAMLLLQKFEGKKFAKGGESTREKAEVYITLDNGKLAFEKIKASKARDSHQPIFYEANDRGMLVPKLSYQGASYYGGDD